MPEGTLPSIRAALYGKDASIPQPIADSSMEKQDQGMSDAPTTSAIVGTADEAMEEQAGVDNMEQGATSAKRTKSGPLISGMDRWRKRIQSRIGGIPDDAGYTKSRHLGTDESARPELTEQQAPREWPKTKPLIEDAGEVFTVGHPSPKTQNHDINKCETVWKNIGSGIMARTFKGAQRLMTTTKDGPPTCDIARRITRSLSTGKIIDDCIVEDTSDEVLSRWIPGGDDIRVELVLHGAMKMYEAKGADISEVFSQPRIAQEAAMKEYGGVRLVPGWSLDLTRDDPSTGQPWDLSKHAVRERVRKLVRDTKPLMLIGSPPCTMFSLLQGLSKNKRDPVKFEKEMKNARSHIKFCIELYRIQMSSGRFFMHEHPHSASSWQLPEIMEMLCHRDVDSVTCDMCAYGMVSEDEHGVAPAQKRTRLMSNSPEVIKRVGRQCANKDGNGGAHRHVQLLSGRAKKCQVYPGAFCQAVCEGVAAEKKLRALGMMAQPLMTISEMQEVTDCTEEEAPDKALHEEDGVIAFDDQSGAPLIPDEVAKARQEEI